LSARRYASFAQALPPARKASHIVISGLRGGKKIRSEAAPPIGGIKEGSGRWSVACSGGSPKTTERREKAGIWDQRVLTIARRGVNVG